MRKQLLALTAVLCLFSFAYSQRTLTEIDENKYSINLPSYWKKNSKAIRILGDKLPLICEELKDKELCGDNCNPAYTVELFLTVPAMQQQYISKTNAQFNNGVNPVTGKVFVTSSQYVNAANPIPGNNPPATNNNNSNGINGWQITTEYAFQCFLLLRDKNEKIISRLILVDTNEVWSSVHTVTRQNGTFSEQNPLTYIEKNQDKLMPTIYQLLDIADTKLLKLEE